MFLTGKPVEPLVIIGRITAALQRVRRIRGSSPLVGPSIHFLDSSQRCQSAAKATADRLEVSSHEQGSLSRGLPFPETIGLLLSPMPLQTVQKWPRRA